MDGLFKRKLLSLRTPPAPKTFAEALLGDTSWLKKVSVPKSLIPQNGAFSEKTQVIEGLERFALERGEELNSDLLKVEGGEILLRSAPTWSSKKFSDLSSLKSSLQLDASYLELIFRNKIPGEIQVLFVTEKFRPIEEVRPELGEGFLNELLAAFPLKTAELFQRMIGAMKLTPEEVLIYPIDGIGHQDCDHDILNLVGHFGPKVIVTLGAQAAQRILKSNDRLTVIHGQFFSRKTEPEGSFQVVPLFHPTIIETNANMKKTAWSDMQKIMKFLKKIP